MISKLQTMFGARKSGFDACWPLLLVLGSCAQTDFARPARSTEPAPQYRSDYGPSDGTRIQGLIGLTEVTDIQVGLDPSYGEIQDEGTSSFPLIGGVFMHPLRGERLRFGLEGGFTVGWEGDTGIVAINNGTVLVVSDNDIFLLDLFVGPFLELPLGQKARVYASAGPLLQYGRVEMDYIDTGEYVNHSETGFGGGVYARTGIEFDIGGRNLIGFGVRWLDSSVSLGGALGDLDFQGVQMAVTATTGF